ncbi:ABC transporter permease [Phytoactinopolyspora mesophila]|uniref:ABC transporter permease n=1 Tax=Phytoactinopolyspora mesophila TaxID=2650750 RepID=A0A7K3M024_9ACTN|nr:ABC transporter permease [Phytoactinopolyspora mesophila]NDL56387.1 ABC transporter permease [Phytoactinopolyspora mesophila]
MTVHTENSRRVQPRSGAAGRLVASGRRIWSLARAEVRLLLRNRTAMFVGAGLPIATVALLYLTGTHEETTLDTSVVTVVSLIGVALLYVIYYNLVSTYVARREDLVLKRLRTGELSDAEILGGVAVPAVLLAVLQVLLVGTGAALLLGLAAPVNMLLVVAAVLGGAAVFVLLAAASSAMTRNVEMAQMSTLPVFIVCIIFSGLFIPLSVMPDQLATAAQFLPLTPVVELSNLGLAGTTGEDAAVGFTETFSAAASPAVILAAWIVIGVELTRRTFRWEPRR